MDSCWGVRKSHQSPGMSGHRVHSVDSGRHDFLHVQDPNSVPEAQFAVARHSPLGFNLDWSLSQFAFQPPSSPKYWDQLRENNFLFHEL